VTLAVLGGLAGCSSGGGPAPLAGTLRVYASTSLTEAITSMAHGFETTYPAVKVEVTFAPDTELASKTAAGPAPDVLALEGAAPLATAGPAGAPVHFASNQLVLVVAADNPRGLGRLADIGRPDVRLALCDPAEPCGAVTTAVLAAASVPAPTTAVRVPDVRSALAKLADGSVDAALVYRSDARSVDDTVSTIEFPESRMSVAEYQAVIPDAAANKAAAQTFLDYLASQSTLDALTGGGFLAPA